MARGKGILDTDLKKLISAISGFDESDDNFGLCWNFVQSNIKYHKFLSVDSHKLSRSVDGLVTKFEINCNYEKAVALRRLVDEFIETPLSDKHKFTQTDAHYSVLQLLLNLADSPTKTDYVEPVVQPQPEEEDDFDWKHHLLEGEDGRQLYPESSDYSDSDEDLSEPTNQIAEKAVSFHSNVKPEAVIGQKEIRPYNGDITSTDNTCILEKGDNWLEKNVVVQYWKGVTQPINAWGDGYQSNLHVDWNRYLSQTDPLHTIPRDTKVTETQLLRELIWMLSGVSDLFVCRYDNGEFSLREDVMISHVTKESLSQSLQVFFQHGSQIQKLQNFVNMATEALCYLNNSAVDQSDISQTYQAFAQCLSQFLQSFNQVLCDTEKIIKQQEETFTLHTLVEVLQPWFSKVQLVYDIFHSGTKDGTTKGDNTELSSNLLSVIFNAVLDYDVLDEKSTDLESLVLVMWIKTSRPYLDIIDEWITNGNLIDPKQEFLIQRSEEVRVLDENFWETGFSIRNGESVVLPAQELSSNEKEENPTERKSVSKTSARSAPKFLQPVLKEVVLAGKSMELLQNLGRLGEVIGCKGHGEDGSQTWYKTFMESLSEALGKTSTDSITDENKSRETNLSVGNVNNSQQTPAIDTSDALLEMNFTAIFDPNILSKEKLTTEEEELEKDLSFLNLSGRQPIKLVLDRCLYPYVNRRYRLVCLKLVEILTQEYRLLDYLTSMRRFFLMEDGETLFDFYTQLFSKVESHERWREYYSLNLVLQEVLQNRYPEEIQRLTVDVTQHSFKAKDSNPINAFDGLRLHYRVPWPVNVVISSSTQKIYNQIFIFLLQIKYAKCSLDRLQFSALERENLFKTIVQPEDAFSRYGNEEEEFDFQDDQEEELPRGQRVHRMQLLRMRLINFVNSLHTFIMTRILHSTGLEFMAEIKYAADLDEIIALHEGYVLKIHDRCLQHKAVAFLKEAVIKVLNLCVIFSTRWQHGVDEISTQSISSLETEFGKYIQFLSSFLNNVVKRGSFPHLEPLAFALITSSEQ